MSIRRRRRINEQSTTKFRPGKPTAPKAIKGKKPTDPIKVKSLDSSKS